ncbi:hypothetical protein D4764_09G0009970 [Takifugu flavidus]|uniref:Alkylated DNA repair protein AlkB homologue 8 N-terminal domain-containing protein n=1 Tax=Takifugu flavidus TaxID=433684 RepID=A0A5C6MRE9_9TELE|nr:hypothetical protein D4764_09G0009970 [Takifugu flavidus]
MTGREWNSPAGGPDKELILNIWMELCIKEVVNIVVGREEDAEDSKRLACFHHASDSFRFLGTTITRDLKREPTISSLIKKAQQRMFFLRQLRKLKLPPRMLAQFYTAIIESILTSSITVWYAGATARDRLRLQRVVRTAEKVIGCRLPSIQDLYISRTRRRAGRITADTSHPGHGLFSPLPSGRRLRSIRTKTSRYMNSFFPSAIRLLNTK